MAMHSDYIDEEGRLDLHFDGNLDLTVSQGICEVCREALPDLRSCIIDLSGVERIFDSGIALLKMLYGRLRELGAVVVVLSDDPRICQRFPMCRASSGKPDARLAP